MTQNPQSSQKISWLRTPYVIWSVAVLLSIVGFAVGRAVSRNTDEPGTLSPLRLEGYQFVSPLLVCNLNPTKTFPEYQSLSSKIQSAINAHEDTGDITKASTYFLDLKNGHWSNVNGENKFYPSSLGKIPIMMAYYSLAENSPAILEKQIMYNSVTDLNKMQDIKPSKTIQPNTAYAIEELIEYMIKYSDNNASELLYQNIDSNSLKNIYGDLQIPINNDLSATNFDFITPQKIATLFRILYNATYISREYSERALKLLSGVDFKNGLVAGVPNNTLVAHKLGLVGIITSPGATAQEHELHDCGIIYSPSHPYLLCVMTRGSSSIQKLANTIADISKIVYSSIQND